MRDRLSPRLQRLAALIVAMALCGVVATAMLHAKKGDKPPARYIHCAMQISEGPCGLDASGRPPDSVRPAPPYNHPDFAPGR
jgi:hypothetical protein